MPTKRDAASFGCRECIEESFAAMGCDDDSIAAYCAGTVADTVGEEVEWIGSHKAAAKEWVQRWYSCTGYFGKLAVCLPQPLFWASGLPCLGSLITRIAPSELAVPMSGAAGTCMKLDRWLAS